MSIFMKGYIDTNEIGNEISDACIVFFEFSRERWISLRTPVLLNESGRFLNSGINPAYEGCGRKGNMVSVPVDYLFENGNHFRYQIQLKR